MDITGRPDLFCGEMRRSGSGGEGRCWGWGLGEVEEGETLVWM